MRGAASQNHKSVVDILLTDLRVNPSVANCKEDPSYTTAIKILQFVSGNGRKF